MPDFRDDAGQTWAFSQATQPRGKVKVKGPNGTFSIPAEVMIAFAVECVRAERIRQLQEAEGSVVLGLGPE